MPLRLLRSLGPLAILATTSLLVTLLPGSFASAQTAPSAQLTSQRAFRGAMAKYWEDHITWTRLFIIADAADSPDLPLVTQRLLQNQVDIGNAIKPFYGDAAGNQLTDLLKQHILIAADIVAAAKANDSARVSAGQTRWQANADDIANFLAAANPEHWPAQEMRAMMRHHLQLTTTEAVARLQGDWAADIAAYDQVHLQALTMSDMLADGIIAQFPSRFSGTEA